MKSNNRREQIDQGLLQDKIRQNLMAYLKVDSITNTKKETLANAYFSQVIDEITYYDHNKDKYGCEAIPGDVHNRSVNWALLKGQGDKTVVLIHHSDVVTIENYKDLKPYAYQPDKLISELEKKRDLLDQEAQEDLDSGKWLFGRGVADMKGGGAIQLAILEAYSKMKEFPGNIIVLMVPDEENMSAGMRHGVKILDRLKKEYKLDYKLMINSEPHQRLSNEKGIISQGSIAKMNVFMYVKGVMTHAGKAYEGINPLGILTKIASDYEMTTKFTEKITGEVSIPPTWISLRDLKKHYDISIPESAVGFLNLLSFDKTPEDILAIMKGDVEDEAYKLVKTLFQNRKEFMNNSRRQQTIQPWSVEVLTYRELLDKTLKTDEIIKAYEDERESVAIKIKNGLVTEFDGTIELVEYLMSYLEEPKLTIVLGIAAPYYPGVSNLNNECIIDIEGVVNAYTQEMYGQTYDNEYFFTGISDLSFTGIVDENIDMSDMPMWNKTYYIPFEEIKSIEMPRVNIGPWGKEFHKIGERVLIEDLYERTPRIIQCVIDRIMDKD